MMRAMADPLHTWLASTLGEQGPFELTPMSGGNSNETVSVTSPRGRWILRRPPAASLAPGAHAMEREHVIMEALAGRPVPSPRPLGVLVAEGVPQTPALLMEHVDGVSLTDTLPDSYPPQPEAARAIGEAVIDALADLHAVPWRDAGLAEFGRPDGFLERQVPRWLGQLERYRAREIEGVDEVARWLTAHRPPDRPPGILHGDYHLRNVMFAPVPPARVVAIVDWEMATIGDPMLDLGALVATWSQAGEPVFMNGSVTDLDGMATRAEIVTAYEQALGRPADHLQYYMALALFKLVCILEGSYSRLMSGASENEGHRRYETLVPIMARRALAIVRGEWGV